MTILAIPAQNCESVKEFFIKQGKINIPRPPQCLNIAGFKKALKDNKLAGIKVAVKHLYNNPHLAAQVVSHLNASIDPHTLLFQWMPANEQPRRKWRDINPQGNKNNQTAQLLVRNRSIGLLIKIQEDFQAQGMMLTPEEPMPCREIAVEQVLSLLSAQVRHQLTDRQKFASNARSCLQLLADIIG